MRLELIFAESAFNKTFLYRRVRAPITKTRPNNTRQRAKFKKSATPTSKGKFYENADSANSNVRHTVVGPPLHAIPYGGEYHKSAFNYMILRW